MSLFKTSQENNCSAIKSSPAPLLFFLGELSGQTEHALLDPVAGIVHKVSNGVAQLEGQLECLCARYGWLLLLSRDNSSLFFFNMLTRQSIEIPYRRSGFNAVAFSDPPTSPYCTVYAVVLPTYNKQHYVDVFRVNEPDRRWVRYRFKPTTHDFNMSVQAICCGDELYCVDNHGRVAIFDAEKYTWKRVTCDRAKAFGNLSRPCLVEYNGEIYAGKKGAYGVLDKVFKLSLDGGLANWVKVEDVGDVGLFFGPYGSCAVSAGLSQFGKQTCISVDGAMSKCIVYNFEEGGFKENIKFSVPANLWSHAPVWVERSC